MRTWFLLIFMLLRGPGWAQSPLEFRLELEKGTCKLGQPILAHMVLKNSSPNPLHVNARLLVNGPYPFEHEVVMKVTGPDGLMPFALLMRTGPPIPQHYYLLRTGRSISNLVDLAHSYAIRKVGVYRIEAAYENRYPKAWVGRLLAPPVEVRVD